MRLSLISNTDLGLFINLRKFKVRTRMKVVQIFMVSWQFHKYWYKRLVKFHLIMDFYCIESHIIHFILQLPVHLHSLLVLGVDLFWYHQIRSCRYKSKELCFILNILIQMIYHPTNSLLFPVFFGECFDWSDGLIHTCSFIQ